MAQLIRNNKTIEVKDNYRIYEAADDLGVLFSCCHGVCGACKIKIISGEENLGEKTVSEEDYGLEEGHRLACQCRIKSGPVEIDQELKHM